MRVTQPLVQQFLLCFAMLFAVTFVMGEPYAKAAPNLIFEDDFDAYTDDLENHGWSEVGGAVSIDPTGGVDGSHAAIVEYNGEGTGPYWFRKSVGDEHLSEIYVSFDFKVDTQHAGSKFLKLFGKINSPQGYANSTFICCGYGTSNLQGISFGDGVQLENDTNAVATYNGTSTDPNVTFEHYTDTFDPVEGQYHHFEAYMKYNTNGNRDGEYKVWIDGQLRLHATNIRNRHDLNSDEFDFVDLANYTADHIGFNIWYDNFAIMDGIPVENPLELPVSSVTASGDDNIGNIAANTLDNDYSTRWSHEGIGQWIEYDLGSEKTVKLMAIAWYRGDDRNAVFDIEVSSDQTNWSTVYSGTASGTTEALELYDMADDEARYVRIVGYGNSLHNWNSILEAKIFGN